MIDLNAEQTSLVLGLFFGFIGGLALTQLVHEACAILAAPARRARPKDGKEHGTNLYSTNTKAKAGDADAR